MATIEVIANVPTLVMRFEDYGHGVHDILRDKLKGLTHDLADYVRDVALGGGALERVSGKLAHSIYEGFEDADLEMTGIVGTTGVPYARPHEVGGEGEYEIVPVKARVLAFVWNGAKVFFARVLHPPAEAKRYLSGSLETFSPLIEAELRAALAAATRV
jgi:hypothetical protein